MRDDDPEDLLDNMIRELSNPPPDPELQKLKDALQSIVLDYYAPNYDALDTMRDLLLALAKKAGAK